MVIFFCKEASFGTSSIKKQKNMNQANALCDEIDAFFDEVGGISVTDETLKSIQTNLSINIAAGKDPYYYLTEPRQDSDKDSDGDSDTDDASVKSRESPCRYLLHFKMKNSKPKDYLKLSAVTKLELSVQGSSFCSNHNHFSQQGPYFLQ
eukprot:TRINITY_DN3571_c1_g1_i1.p1 TRINITY_DN3571_c1_g1~~TRINITY_DN3571_c1_g1_i1.p1  ORF type:complete len:150 (+),score=29.52 TRINITY_DN3571_c1_g1_i1:551-1000(+)